MVVYISCTKECDTTSNQLLGKFKSLTVISVGSTDSAKTRIEFYYSANKIDSLSYILSRFDANGNPIKILYSLKMSYLNNAILLSQHYLNYVLSYRKYKVYLQNNPFNRIYEVDTLTNAEYPYLSCVFNTKLDTIYEPAVYPTALNRYCYDYVLEDGNYTQFKFDYDVATFLGGLYHVADTAFITYTTLPFNKYAPMQNMYSSSTLFNLGAPGEVIYDFNYILGFEDYYLYPHNQNLIQSIRTVHDSTTIVYFNYEFNTQNQLSKVKINFREPTSTFLEYDYEYY